MYFFYIWQIDSTQNHSKALKNLHSGNVTFWVQSVCQIHGRGQRGKKWDCFEGNLFLTGSFLLPKIALSGRLAISVGVTLAKILQSFLPNQQIGLKWPNDLLCNNKKVGGVLVEIEGIFAHVGIGLNIFTHPDNTAMPATHLQAYKAVDVNALRCAIINAIGKDDLENFQSIQELWWLFAQNTISCWGASEFIGGEVIGIDGEGQLLVQAEDGQIFKRHHAFDAN